MSGIWQAGTVYQPGEIVIPTAISVGTSTTPGNAAFADGDTGWTKGSWAINTNGAFSDTYAAELTATGDDLVLVNDTKADISPGQSITARCMVQGSGDSDDTAAVILRWYTDADALISTDTGNTVGGGTNWKESRLTATAPATAAKVAVGAIGQKESTAAVRVDSFTWNHVSPGATIELAFKAINTEAGLSGATEPTWPTVVGNTVVDNEVEWEAIEARTVTWQASPVLVSGTDEPVWPIEGDAFVADGTIAWKAIPYRITDPNCPNTKEVAIGASKVFAGDEDVVRFSATYDPRDWTTAQDAGFLPSGLQQKGQVAVTALGMYRGNLCVWSGSSFQMWQIDPDPAAMALLDAMEGIGTIHYRAVQAVNNDLFFVPALGVRTVGLSAGSGSLQAGDVGMPIDPLVQAAIVGKVPLATYYPSAGQYWLTTSKTAPVPVLDRVPLLCPLLDDAWVGVPYSYTPSLSDDVEDVSWEITEGELPDGLELDPVTGEISGTPTMGSLGTATFTLTATADGYSAGFCQHSLRVMLAELWLTKTNTNNDKLWVSQDGGGSWLGPYTRSPFIERSGGPVAGGDGVGLIWHTNGTCERITDFVYADGVTTTSVTMTSAGGSINLKEVGDLLFAPRSSSNTVIAYSEDEGVTWSTTTVGTSGGAMYDIDRIGSRWITADFGVAPRYFFYSDEEVPTTWTQATRHDSGSGGSAGQQFVVGDSAAVSFKNASNYWRTTDGITWTETTLANHEVSVTNPAIAIGDILIVPIVENGNTRIKRSTDAGVSWTNVTVSASADTITKFTYDPASGVLIACGGTHRVWRSTDQGATWSAQTLPFSPAPGSDVVRAGFIRRTA